MSNFQPLILIYNQEIDIIEEPSDLENLLYGMSETQQKDVVLLDKTASYRTLKNIPLPALSSRELATLVKHYLAKEGQCCLAKIDHITPAQAFDLLAIN
ncbi:hypothetical protein [Pseudoalteromonas sp. H105]|jgi:hypothetical protein|uniref:hypothetical protein n=1 Tax=Pseudoalteromonas sp. H105 TaxID=1348393 RepID=UPI0007323893|nr:hypothetical protein [Pseudoalteromonas sp. H105]KTF12166.1 hypothetical protein ATS75_18160 [Pseudoalteromonas sp. H105]